MADSILDERKIIYKQIGKDEYINEKENRIKKRSEEIGKMLTTFRLERRYTQQEISSAVNIAQQTYAGYESGRHEPSVETLIRIADIYGISLDLLTGRYESTTIGFIKDAVLNEQIERSKDDGLDEQIEMLEHQQKRKYNRAKKK